MAIRFAPFARVRVLSLASVLLEVASAENVPGLLMTKLADTARGILNFDPSGAFTDVGLATDITITENFNTRLQYGIGEPANPIIVPGNMSVRVTMSRLTTDSKQMADYVTKPSFYYSSVLQRFSAYFGSTLPLVNDLDFLFYTYLHIGSIETATNTTGFANVLDGFQNFEVIAFMPSSFTKRLGSQNAEVVTDVEGEGKLFKLSEVMQAADDILKSITGVAEGLLDSELPGSVSVASA